LPILAASGDLRRLHLGQTTRLDATAPLLQLDSANAPLLRRSSALSS
jgi:hypothetical protein